MPFEHLQKGPPKRNVGKNNSAQRKSGRKDAGKATGNQFPDDGTNSLSPTSPASVNENDMSQLVHQVCDIQKRDVDVANATYYRNKVFDVLN